MIQPAIGMWWAPCCLHDLQEITSAEDIEDVLSFIELGPFRGLWPTRQAALMDLLSEETSPRVRLRPADEYGGVWVQEIDRAGHPVGVPRLLPGHGPHGEFFIDYPPIPPSVSSAPPENPHEPDEADGPDEHPDIEPHRINPPTAPPSPRG
jgi:hypothetical protein